MSKKHYFKISHWTISHISIDAMGKEDAKNDAYAFTRQKFGPIFAQSIKPCENPGGEFFQDNNDPDWTQLRRAN
jgi:hypothetical protein